MCENWIQARFLFITETVNFCPNIWILSRDSVSFRSWTFIKHCLRNFYLECLWSGAVWSREVLLRQGAGYLHLYHSPHICTHKNACSLLSIKKNMRRKIRLIENNAKCRYLKKLTLKGTFRQVFFLFEAPSPPMTPYSPPLTHCIRVYSILIHTGKGC